MFGNESLVGGSFRAVIFILLTTALLACRDAAALDRPAPEPTASPESEISPGRLAYIGGDGNVYVTSADLTNKVAVTTDATAAWEDSGRSYQRLAWSTGGQLAFASVTRLAHDRAESSLYVTAAPGQPARLIGQSDAHFVIYVYWSPQPCPGRPTCRHLAYLIEEAEDITLRLVEIDGAAVDNQIIGFGWPYYFSWAADGGSILWHTGLNEAAQLARYELNRAVAQPLPFEPAEFMAPAWSPTAPLWLAVSREDGETYLHLFEQDTPQPIAPISGDLTAFSWAPDGQQVAYASKAKPTDRFYGPIYHYDRTSGQSSQLTATSLQTLAFFWDPGGQRLGYLTLLTMPHNVEWMQWRVIDVAQGEDRGFMSFNPSPQLRFVVDSFNQYSQSHRLWSPDGRYLVYGERNETTGQTQVRLIDTWDEDGRNSILVDEGSMGFWSWE